VRRNLAAAAVILALIPSAYLAWNARDLPHLGYFHDDSIYLVGAKSLAEGQGYRIASLPGAPYQTKYPPLYPLLLAALWSPERPLAGNLGAVALLAWLMVPLYVLAAGVALRDLGLHPGETWWLCALIAANPFVALFGISLLSELPFTVLLVAALALTDRARRGPVRLALIAGALAGLAYLTRSAGIVLLASGPAVLWAGGRRKHAAAYAAAMLPAVAGWTLWSHFHRLPTTDASLLYYTDYLGFYLRDIANLPEIAWRNLDVMANSTGGMLLLNTGESWWTKSIARVLAAAAVVGAARLVRRDGWSAYTAFAAGYLALLLVWNYLPDQRFLLPVFPLLAAGLLLELRRVAGALRTAWRSGRRGDRAAAVCAGAVCAAVLALALVQNVAAYRFTLPGFVARYRTAFEANRTAYAWISANTPRDARFFADMDAVLYLYTGRRACRLVVPPGLFYRTRDRDVAAFYSSMPGYARAHGLTYALVTPRDLSGDVSVADRTAARRMFTRDARLRLAHDAPGASVYRVN
jgi:hypothetical protein